MSEVQIPARVDAAVDARVDADAVVDVAVEIELACCVNTGCGNRFDPSCEGWNGECDACAALAADHFAGDHEGQQLDCLFCVAAQPLAAGWLLSA